MKKLLRTVLILFSFLSITAYANEIAPGDYIKMGAYGGEPIIWRCIEVNSDGALMISDQIITLKAYDAAGDSENDTFGYRSKNGSNLWSGSTIRAWLNSDTDTVTYEGTAPDISSVTENAYSSERGFLRYFSESEKSLIKTAEITTVINSSDADYASSGSEEHTFNFTADTLLTNLDTAYVQTTADKIFLPSVRDIHNIANNPYTFAPIYHITFPTDSAVIYSELGFHDLDTNDSWGYWLRDAVSYAKNNDLVRIVTKDGTVNYDSANNGVMGVRPMFYIDTDNAVFSVGTGKKNNPYTVRTGKWLEITDGDFATEADRNVALNIYSEGLDECEIKLYVDGEQTEHSNGNTVFERGIHSVYATAETDGEVIAVSDSITVTAIEYDVEKSMLSNDFEASSTYDGFAGHSAADGVMNLISDENGSCLYLESPEESGKTAPYLILPHVPDDAQTVLIEADFNFQDYGYSIFSLKFKPTNTWLNMIKLNEYGQVVFSAYDGVRTVLAEDIGLNEWHNYKMVYDIKNSELTFFIDNKATVINAPVSFNEFKLNYCNINAGGNGKAFYIDNVVQKIVGENPMYSVSYEKNGTNIFYTDCENGAGDFASYGEKSGSIAVVDGGEDHGKVLRLTTTGSGGDAAYLITPSLSSLSDEVLVEADYKFTDCGKSTVNLLSLKTLPDSEWIILLYLDASGNIVLKGTTGKERTVLENVDPDKWYNVRIIFNKPENTAAISINDEVYTKVNIALTGYTDFNYVNIGAGTLTDSTEAAILVDNVKAAHAQKFVSPYETNVINVVDPCSLLEGNKLITAAYKDNRLTAVKITAITDSGEYIVELEDAKGGDTLRTFIVEDIESLKSVPMNAE